MLDEIKKDFEWGKKTSERGYLNLDDEQVEWLINTVEQQNKEIIRLQDVVISINYLIL